MFMFKVCLLFGVDLTNVDWSMGLGSVGTLTSYGIRLDIGQ